MARQGWIALSLAAMGKAGHKPDVPPFVPVNLQEEQAKAIQGNIAAMPDLSRISSAVTDQRIKDIEKQAPGTMDLRASLLNNINQLLSGELPKDVTDYLQRKGAEYAASSGTIGSGFAKAKTLRDLGLTSLGMQEKGMAAAQRWLESANALPSFDVTSMFVTPMQSAAFQAQQNEFKFGRDWLANQVKAMPSPYENVMMQVAANHDEIGYSIAEKYMGGGMGGGMGGMMGSGGGGGGGVGWR